MIVLVMLGLDEVLSVFKFPPEGSNLDEYPISKLVRYLYGNYFFVPNKAVLQKALLMYKS